MREKRVLKDLYECVVRGNASLAKVLTEQALMAGAEPLDVIDKALMAALNHVNGMFRDGRCVIPDVLLSSRAVHASLHLLETHNRAPRQPSIGTVVIGTVAGDLHDIGKKIVVMMMETENMEVIDLGIDVPTEDFLAAVRRYSPDILAMSALLTTTLPSIQKTVEGLKREGLRDSVLVAVGGRPVSEAFASGVGADIYAYDAVQAARACRERLLGTGVFRSRE